MKKKVVACLLAAIMTLGAVGCSSDTSTNTTSPKEESTEEEAPPAESESEESAANTVRGTGTGLKLSLIHI